MSSATVYYGCLINPLDLTSYQALPRCLLAVNGAGNIDFIVDDVEESMVQQVLSEKGYIDVEVTPLKRSEFILPGLQVFIIIIIALIRIRFVPTSFPTELIDRASNKHAPQFTNIGSGQQYELLDWLTNVTFPMEAKFADLEFARRAYTSTVRRVLDNGTTTCCYYGTLHLEATKLLADILHLHGQRAFVGKCNMDRNCPDFYIEPSAKASINDTVSLITHIRSLDTDSPVDALVQPILTPRFAISCSDSLLSELGSLASSDPGLRIQTHVSENKAEIKFTKELFPNSPTYAHVYDHFGLLRHNTVLAHAVHLEPKEVDLIASRRAGISHCANSNFHLRSGVAPIGEYLDRGIKVGLGTDVSGGFSPSILNSVQNASIAAKVVAVNHGQEALPGKFANRQLSIATLLHLATLGGAQVCDLDKQIGSFAQGKSFDALIVDADDKAGNPGLWGTANEDIGREGKAALEAMLESFLFCGDDRNIGRVYVQGRFVGGRHFTPAR